MMKLVVLCCVVAAVVARAPVYFTPQAVPVPSAIGQALPLQQFYNYRGPLSLAPGQPANILAADGRPLDTLEVNLDRSAHITAKALERGLHALQKRSLTRLAVVPGSAGYAAAVATGNVGIAAPVGVNPATLSIATNPIGIATQLAPGPIAVSAPIAANPLRVAAPFAAGPIAVSAPIVSGPIAVSAPIAAGPIAFSARTGVTPNGIAASVNPIVRAF